MNLGDVQRFSLSLWLKEKNDVSLSKKEGLTNQLQTGGAPREEGKKGENVPFISFTKRPVISLSFLAPQGGGGLRGWVGWVRDLRERLLGGVHSARWGDNKVK